MKKFLFGMVLFTLILTGCEQETTTVASNSISSKSPSSSPTNVVSATFTLLPSIPGLKVVSSHLDVSTGQEASLTIQVRPGTKATIEVDYSSGPSQDNSLLPKIADKNGDVTWSWKVPLNTTLGTWNVTVTANEKSMMLPLHVTK